MAKKTSKIHVQISIHGKGASHLSHDALVEAVRRTVDGDEIPGLDVRIQLWRAGREIDWQDDNPSTAGLRKLIRGTVQSGRFPFQVRSH